jgi:acetyl-CoA carboxylase biotin carboxyl carrier protein
MDLDLEELAAIIELLGKADFTDFLYEKGDLRIAVRRGGPRVDQFTTAGRTPPFAQPTGLQSRWDSPSPRRPGAVAPEGTGGPRGGRPAGRRDGPHPLRHARHLLPVPKPGDPPFVEVGDKVEATASWHRRGHEVDELGDRRRVSGERSPQRTRESGDLVEFDQPLFSVRPLP